MRTAAAKLVLWCMAALLGGCRASITSKCEGVTCTAVDQCHAAGACDPATGTCSNPTKADGAVCGGLEETICTYAGTCQAGTCSGPPKPDGTACTDSNACTTGDACQAGVCLPVSRVVCSRLDDCHDAGTCDPATGSCSNPARADGTACGVAETACTLAGTCQSGICSGAKKPDGSRCDDGNACTRSDVCQSGVCRAGSWVACAPADQCHDAGTCDPDTGTCSTQPSPDGTACGDGNACTQADTCLAGTCRPGPSVECPGPDACHDAGTCDPATGLCSNPPKTDGTICGGGSSCTEPSTCRAGQCVGAGKPDGTPCEDGNYCTQADTCAAGVCASGPPIDCSAPDLCHAAGTCNPATGACSQPQAKVCTPIDNCHDAGTCDPATGACSTPAKPDGTDCGVVPFSCLVGMSCLAGVCQGGGTLTCPARDQCHDNGTCVAPTGCVYPEKADGTPCNDADACTQGDTCQAGVCSGTPFPPGDVTPPTTPTLVQACWQRKCIGTSCQTSWNLAWTISTDTYPGLGSYVVWRGTYLQATVKPPKHGWTTSSYIGDGLPRNCFQVTARDCSGNESARSNEMCVTQPCP